MRQSTPETRMKKAFLAAGICTAAVVFALAAQNREFDRGGPMSRLGSALDADHDGIISRGEIRSSAVAIKALDANGDGRLTPDELRPALGPGGRGGDGPPPS